MKERHAHLVFGVILGWFSMQLVYVKFSTDGMWTLTLFGIAIAVLGFVHYFGKANSKPKYEEAKDERKTLLGKVKSWSK